MKVFCIINRGFWKSGKTGKYTTDGPKFGEICTVTGIVGHKTHDGYLLAEYPQDRSYRCEEFVLLSDIDELKIVNELENA